jgi:molecular chaperone HtpG
VKPILEINVDDPMIKKIEASDNDEYLEEMCSVLLDQALLAEGVMPKDPVSFTKKLHSLLSK